MAWQDPHGQPDWRDAYGQYGQNPYSQQYGEPQDSPPPGYAQDPYSQGSYGQGAYGQDPYGQASYAQDPYGQYSYGPPGVGPRTGSPGLTIAALVANIASAILCCGIGLAWIPGIILAAVALSRNTTDPESARKLTIGAWVCFVIDVALTVVGIILLGVFSDSHSSTTY